jgi:type I restriction enzyme S subunit
MNEMQLGELLSERGITYGVVQPGDHTAGGIPLLKAADIGNGTVNIAPAFRISHDKHREHSRTELTGGELLITLVGIPGQCAIAPAETRGFNVVRAVGVFSVEPNALNRYVMYAIQAPSSQHHIKNICNTTVQATLNLGDLKGLPLRVPSLSEQKAIAHILGTLDDKIELNRKSNETLEAMARALFKSWFVDFDPVRARAEGRPTGLPDEISDLFPDSFEDSVIGEIPSGWAVKALDEIAQFLNGLALQKFPPEDDGPTLPVIKIAQLKKGDALGADRCSTSVPEDYVIRDGDVLFSWSGSLAVDMWCGGDGALNQHLFKVTSKTYGKWFFYQWVKHHLPYFQEIAQSKATTMGHIQRHHLSEAQALIPTPSVLGAMDSVFASMLDRSFVLRKQSRELSCIRDNLLPKLISGELRIPEAERLLEEAGV